MKAHMARAVFVHGDSTLEGPREETKWWKKNVDYCCKYSSKLQYAVSWGSQCYEKTELPAQDGLPVAWIGQTRQSN